MYSTTALYWSVQYDMQRWLVTITGSQFSKQPFWSTSGKYSVPCVCRGYLLVAEKYSIWIYAILCLPSKWQTLRLNYDTLQKFLVQPEARFPCQNEPHFVPETIKMHKGCCLNIIVFQNKHSSKTQQLFKICQWPTEVVLNDLAGWLKL